MTRGRNTQGGTGSSESGFTIIELLVAMTVLAFGLVAVMGSVDVAGRAAVSAQKNEQAVSIAQREIERIKNLSWADVGLTSLPASASHGNPAGDTSTNPTNPRYYVSGTNLLIKTNYRDWTSGTVAGVAAGGEQMVSGGDVAPGPDTFSANGRSGKIYRFVSWRDENCSGNRCPGTQDSKRVTVAVVLDAARGGPSKPLWFSSIVNNPDAGAPGSHSPPVSNPGTGSNVSAQPFFLTDTGCNQAARQVPAGSHATDDTSRASTTCASATRPDLMVPDLPTMGVEPLLDFSTDLIRTNPLGLALKRRDATCPVTYTATDAPEAKKSIHTWASPPMASLVLGAFDQRRLGAVVLHADGGRGGCRRHALLHASEAERHRHPHHARHGHLRARGVAHRAHRALLRGHPFLLHRRDQ